MWGFACSAYSEVAYADNRQGVALGTQPLLVVQCVTKLGAYIEYQRHRHQAVVNLYVVSCYHNNYIPLCLLGTSPN